MVVWICKLVVEEEVVVVVLAVLLSYISLLSFSLGSLLLPPS